MTDEEHSNTPALQTVLSSLRAVIRDETVIVPPTNPDWDAVRSIAKRHQITPLVYEGLSTAENPPPILERMHEDVQENAKRNLHLANQLTQLVDDFGTAGSRVIPYKGVALTAVEYGDLHRRMFLDLDFLVPPTEVLTAEDVLRRNQYRPSEQVRTLRRLGRDVPLIGSMLEGSFYHAPTGNEVELRWRLGLWGLPVDVPIEDLWRRRTTARVAGASVPVLSSEDRLLVLTYHGTKHAWRRLAWLVDIAMCLRDADDLDLSTVTQRAENWGTTVHVHSAIVLVTTLFGTKLPKPVLSEAFADRRAVLLARRTITRLARDPLGTPPVLEKGAYNLVATDSVLRVPQFLLRKAVQPRRSDYVERPLPRPLWSAYVFLKAGRNLRLFTQQVRQIGESIIDARTRDGE